MNTKTLNLVKCSPYLLYKISVINLEHGYTEIVKERFVAIALEKSKAAKNWEDTDYFKVIIVVQAADENYYISEIEHPADILAPKYVNDDMRIWWVEENTEVKDRVFVSMISDLYALNDSRCEYTLTINDKPYQFCEKYIIYKLSASYEIWENSDKSMEVCPFLNVRCQFDSQHWASALEGTPTKILQYPIGIYSLLQTSIFAHHPFKIWDGKVTIDGINVTLESN